MFNCIDKSSASNKLHGYSGLFDSTARAFCLVQVWLPDLREIDVLRTISKGECKTSKTIFRQQKLYDDMTQQIQCGRENETGEKS